MKNIIFEVLNQCRGSLAGCLNTDFSCNSKIYGIPSSENNRVKHLLRRPAKVPSLNCSKDDGIFIYSLSIGTTLIRSVEMVYNTLKATQPRRRKYTGVCLTDFTGQNKRNDKRPIAGLYPQISYPNWMRGLGRLIFSLHSSTSLSLAH